MSKSIRKQHDHAIKLFRKKKYQAALEALQAALDEAGPDDAQTVAEMYNDLGAIYKQLEEYPAAHQALDEAYQRFTDLENVKGQAQAIGNRASVFEAEGDAEQAVEMYKASARLLEEIGESDMAMYAWQAVSKLRTKQGQYIAAIGAYEEGVENMPERSFKRKIMQNILKMPGSMLGGLPNTSDEPDKKKGGYGSHAKQDQDDE